MGKWCKTPNPLAPVGRIPDWESGIDFEVDHHTKWIRKEIATGGWFDYERETKLKGIPIDTHQKAICSLFSKVYKDEAKDQVKILLDHGAGPFTNLGKRFQCDYKGSPMNVMNVSAQVIAVDPLAPRYHEILTREKIFNTLRTSYCPSEELTKCLGKNSVDFAIIINALDHSADPIFAFLESMRSVRIGGISCVFSTTYEASNMNGAGFHQWDFSLETSSLEWVVENYQTKKKTKVDSITKSFAKRLETNDVMIETNGKQVFICYQKTAEVSL